MKRLSLLVLLLVAFSQSAKAEPQLVTMTDGTYRAILPSDWDGKRTLPLVLYLPGFREDSAKIAADADLVRAVTELGALLVIADGLDQSWSFQGAPGRKRDDIAFLHAVVSDATKRWPIDERQVFATGFSIGASMVWDLACHSANGFAAFLPFSGDFWMPYPERCETGPVDLRHTHAINDHTFPMGGRPLFGGQFHQGDVHQGFAILEATNACEAEPDVKTQEGALDCDSWTRCKSGRQLEMCLHNGDHQIQPDWLHRSVIWAMKRAQAKS